MKTFNSLEEIKPFYNEKTNTYEFIENDDLFDVCFEFNLKIRANIKAWNIKAHDINALDIDACGINACDINACDINACNIYACDINALDIDAYDINACDINACDINYGAVCFAYCTFKCKSIVGRRENAKHFCLDSEIIIS